MSDNRVPGFHLFCSTCLLPANVTISVSHLLLAFILSAPHVGLESENSSAGTVSLGFFLFLPSTRTLKLEGSQGMFPLSEGFLFFSFLSLR